MSKVQQLAQQDMAHETSFRLSFTGIATFSISPPYNAHKQRQRLLLLCNNVTCKVSVQVSVCVCVKSAHCMLIGAYLAAVGCCIVAKKKKKRRRGPEQHSQRPKRNQMTALTDATVAPGYVCPLLFAAMIAHIPWKMTKPSKTGS